MQWRAPECSGFCTHRSTRVAVLSFQPCNNIINFHLRQDLQCEGLRSPGFWSARRCFDRPRIDHRLNIPSNQRPFSVQNSRIMSSRPSTHWRRFLSRYEEARPRPFSTSRQYAAASFQRLPLGTAAASLRRMNPEMIPVYSLLGFIMLSVTLGLVTAKQELVHSPNVFVDKKKRETFPEVKDPDYVLKKWQDVVNKSFFRRIAEKGKKILQREGLTPLAGDTGSREIRAETLKSVGVEI